MPQPIRPDNTAAPRERGHREHRARRRGALVVAVSLLVVGCQRPAPAPPAPLPPADLVPAVSPAAARELVDRRCVVCHACYDAPCQLVLTSHEGLTRGASKENVYHGSRLLRTAPTRLGIDAHDDQAWRERGFWSVLETDGDTALLRKMLGLGRATPPAADRPLPADFPLDITRALVCPTGDEFADYTRAQPRGGMPYGTAPLTPAEWKTLDAWAAGGAPPPPDAPPLSPPLAAQVAEWERFLNGASPKERLTARYLYEHWFLAHLYFADHPAGPFFRVLRSRTAPGTRIDEIATRRPYDPPGDDPFWYRLERIEGTLVHKTHIVYPLDAARMARLRALFLDTVWSPGELPGYGVGESANPFVAFSAIPARSRYQFLLDDARYFVMTFIRGPVCRGQTAVDVIEDHFYVMFLDPDADVAIRDPAFLPATRDLLSLPAAQEGLVTPSGLWLVFNLRQARYLEKRVEAYERLDPEHRGFGLEAIWDGDGENPNALLTVFRNFDNAMVRYGFVGERTETAWVIDYPILERIYYDLVAGFDVFGNVRHQLSTRLYMDHLRMQSETLFLAFLPPERREPIRASWYRGATDDRSYRVDRIRSGEFGTQIPFERDDVVNELLDAVAERTPALAAGRSPTLPADTASPASPTVDAALRPLDGVRGAWVAQLPELSLLHVRPRTGAGIGTLYTLVHHRAHTNVASLFKEDERLEPEKDTVTVAPGVLGSYPNFLFEVDADGVEGFVAALQKVSDVASFTAVVDRYGVRRTSPRFWPVFDALHDHIETTRPTTGGLLDLNRYENL